MTARTPAQLKTNMPSGTPGGTTITDMHDFIDTVDARTTFSVKEFGALGTVDSQSTAAADTAAFLAATAAAAALPNGAGAVYVPSGFYHINPNQWSLPSKMKVFGDGYASKIRKNGDGWLLNISGTGNWAAGTQVRNSNCIIRDLQFDGRDNDDCLVRIIYGSEVLFDKVRFSFNAGPGIDATEWWDSRINNCFFDWCGDINNPSLLLRNSSNATVDALGYSEDSTNAIYIYGTRFESFKNGALWLDRGPVVDNSPVSQVFMTNCKMETSFLNGPFIKFTADAQATNVHIDTLFAAINSFNTGYTTSTDLIEWNVNNSCSIRNLWVHNGQATTLRTVVKATISFNTCTLENIFISGNKPTVGVVETNSTSEAKLLGYIGGNTNSMEAIVNAKGNGMSRTLTAARQATQLDNGITYINTGSTDYVVTLPDYTSPGWTCQALQSGNANTLGTITFQKVVGSNTTFLFENGTDHRRTGGANAMVFVRCVSNNSTMNGAVYHVRGKTVAQAGT